MSPKLSQSSHHWPLHCEPQRACWVFPVLQNTIAWTYHNRERSKPYWQLHITVFVVAMHGVPVSVIFQVEVGAVCHQWSGPAMEPQNWSASMRSIRVTGPCDLSGAKKTGMWNGPECYLPLSGLVFSCILKSTSLLDLLRLFPGASCISANL